MAGSSPPPLEKSGPASTVSPGSGIVQTRGSRLWGQGEGSRRAVTSSDTPPCRRVLADRKPSRILFPPAGYQRPLDQGIKPNSHWGVPGERDPGGDTNVAATVRPPVRQSTRPVQPIRGGPRKRNSPTHAERPSTPVRSAQQVHSLVIYSGRSKCPTFTSSAMQFSPQEKVLPWNVRSASFCPSTTPSRTWHCWSRSSLR